MRAEHLSCPEAAKRFGIQSKTQVARWERIYLEEGKEDLCNTESGRMIVELYLGKQEHHVSRILY